MIHFLLFQENHTGTSASSHKMQLMNIAVPTNPDTSQQNHRDPTPSENLSGCRLIDMSMLSSLFEDILCPHCQQPCIYLQEIKRLGLNSHLCLSCINCNILISRASTSQEIGPYKISTSNIRIVASSRNCGIGYDKLVKFCAGLDMPQPIHLKTYQKIARKVHTSAMIAQEECYRDAAKAVRNYYMSCDNTLTEDSIIPIVVSYDGTWHKRGHSSHYGVGVVIELNTGLVLDTEVLSNICHACNTQTPKRSDATYQNWCDKHKKVCQKNYEGSAPSMEVGAAKSIFSRSEELHKLKYLIVLCDGDAKTINTLNSDKIYKEEIRKEDCVNHIAKRLWKGIETLKIQYRGTPDAITGKNKVTAHVQNKLSGYYAQALKTYAPDTTAMKNGVYASLFHMTSTDEDPHHNYCPDGSTSWCHYKRAIAKNEPPRKHTATLQRIHANKLLPLYKRLTDPALLERCSRMKTQNANECYNGQVWRRCPKSEPSSKNTIEVAVAMASLEFNIGPHGFSKVLDNLSVETGANLHQHMNRAAIKRVRAAERQMTPENKNKRKRQKLDKATKSDQREKVEGTLYEAGAFNN